MLLGQSLSYPKSVLNRALHGKYLDIDPAREERESMGLNAESGENFNVNPMGDGHGGDTASWPKIDQHRKLKSAGPGHQIKINGLLRKAMPPHATITSKSEG